MGILVLLPPSGKMQPGRNPRHATLSSLSSFLKIRHRRRRHGHGWVPRRRRRRGLFQVPPRHGGEKGRRGARDGEAGGGAFLRRGQTTRRRRHGANGPCLAGARRTVEVVRVVVVVKASS